MDYGLLTGLGDALSKGTMAYTDADDKRRKYELDAEKTKRELAEKIAAQEFKKQERELNERKFGLDEDRARSQEAYQKAMLGQKDKELSLKAQELDAKKSGGGLIGGKMPSKEQFDAAGFTRRMQQSQDVFDDLENGGYNRADRFQSFSSSFLPGEFQDPNLRRQEQAEKNFLKASLRRESGASISPEEERTGIEQYFPRPGDTAEVLAQKRANRIQVMEALKAGAGDALERVPYISPFNNNPGVPQKLNISQEGLQSLTGPKDPKIDSYAKQYGLSYDQAKSIIDQRRGGK